MKKNILFVMNNLNCGGAEKALISLLQTIDYSRYNVDLYLFKHEGIFLKQVPKEVNILPEPVEYQYFDMSINQALLQCLKKGRIDIILARIVAGYIFRTEKNAARREQRIWKYLRVGLKSLNKKYDVAIGYLEKTPIYFCVDKVEARKRIGFIHNDYNELGMDVKIDYPYFNNLANILTVSEKCKDVLRNKFSTYATRIKVMYNIISPQVINKLAMDKVDMNKDTINIVSVGRLNYQKGFELAIAACDIVKKSGYKVSWFILGEGKERERLQQQIIEKGLEENFILLGIKENPYPYVKNADIYIQPSRFEGKSIAIDEAKILAKPIIVTNFTTAKDQINHENNGLIVEMNEDAIAEGIIRLIEDKSLRNQLISNLQDEQLGTEAEINKLYQLIE